ncbi:hypothetical protein B9Z55_027156 [Caenorhabditis nigoni]|uniref:F-box domain-containing protein n=1 Tax=Caenorhabditis nigoni TaxID=1611254 RepID=A0A2G5SH06_9PELO|nr:hypothetical protein B9Z55_027156 [Caenorhabditis nigoni]
MPIDLLKFPNDLLREVFRLCYPFDLYKLSKCSKKCSQKSITLGATKKWKIELLGVKLITISVDGGSKYPNNYYFNRTDNPEEYFETKLGGYIHNMYIEFPNGGAVEVFFYLLDTFGIRIVKSLKISLGNIVDVSEVAKVLVNRNLEIEHFGIENTEEVQDVVNFMPMLNQMNITQEFECILKFPPDFNFEFVKYPSQIYIKESFWFNINQLLHCTCAQIKLDFMRSLDSMSNQDLDLFLQEWKKPGAFPNLRVLQIESKNIDDQSPILDMIPPITTADNPRIKVSADPADTVVEEIPNNEDDD